MSSTTSPLHLIDIDGFESLVELALDLRWSWNHATDKVWRRLDADLWEQLRSPWGLLQATSRDSIVSALGDADFRAQINDLLEQKNESCNHHNWFQKNYAASSLGTIAYFSMEFMLSESLPIYSGGLGNVAGDHLKGASDLGIPVVGVGLLYQQGYFRQLIDAHGAQQAVYPYNDPGQLPIRPLRQADGEWLRLCLDFSGRTVWLRAWQVQVGRVHLYLLDSNDVANSPAYRGITSELYAADPELRLMQEIILGIGGWRLLTALAIAPDVCHLNEGHAAFAALERARQYMLQTACSFDVALTATRTGNLFTTHTAVTAGFDRFSPSLIEQYLGDYARTQLHISVQDLLALGRTDAATSTDDFNMAYLAIRASGAVNAVSQLHGEVSRELFAPLFPRWPLSDVPVSHVTNGVHMPSWDSAAADELWTAACCKARWLGDTHTMGDEIRQLSDTTLWQFRARSRAEFIDYVRTRLTQQLRAVGESDEKIERATRLFDPNVLTIGFARRFATYKRPNLLLHQPERFIALITNAVRPVQIIIAGKAHPADAKGQALIQQWNQFIVRPEVRPHVVFLSDYDMLLAEKMVQGVDLWLNTPRRPWEACGTSGMKALVNGVINLSELDGWWAEAYSPHVGWALGDGKEHPDEVVQDAIEANALYDLLEHQVIPEFYQRDRDGIPTAWVSKIRESMAQLTPRYSTNRSLRDYLEQHYIPLARVYQTCASNGGELAAKKVKLKKELQRKWALIRFGDVSIQRTDDDYSFEVQVYLDGLDYSLATVELYADATEKRLPVRVTMLRDRQLVGAENGGVYSAKVRADRPESDFTVRVIPAAQGLSEALFLSVPLECNDIVWHH